MQDYVVGDLMTIDPIVTSDEARIQEAQGLLELYGISGLPVVDGHGDLVGVVSQTDLLRGGADAGGPLRRHPGLLVGHLMTSPAITVELLTPLAEAARVMRDQHVHRVVAVNEHGQPVGVLSSMDFVNLYADGGVHPA